MSRFVQTLAADVASFQQMDPYIGHIKYHTKCYLLPRPQNEVTILNMYIFSAWRLKCVLYFCFYAFFSRSFFISFQLLFYISFFNVLLFRSFFWNSSFINRKVRVVSSDLKINCRCDYGCMYQVEFHVSARKFICYVHNSPPLDSILGQLNNVHILKPTLLKI